jgi:CrcB protein
MNRLFWICAGGAAGTAARYLIGVWAGQRFGASFPYGTLIVNVSGCFLIALLMHLAMVNGWPVTVRAALTIGFLGGYTTYSSFNYETMRLMEEGGVAPALANVIVTLICGVAAGWLGLVVARQLAGR